jgi:hypothetical protein
LTEYYVSNSGNDENSGKDTNTPFRTIREAVEHLNPGDTLYLREGIYLETVKITGKHPTKEHPIVIRSYPGEHAYIDGCLPLFGTLDICNWFRASLDDPEAHEDEYISSRTFTNDPVNRGAFLDACPYTRLITYSNVKDLRAKNETFDMLIDYPEKDPRPGEVVYEECSTTDPSSECEVYQDGNKYKPGLVKVKCQTNDLDPKCALDPKTGDRYKSIPYRYPYVYMGPGLWFDRETRRVHIRLSHTGNNIPGLADYTGETDPNQVRLAISPKSMITLQVLASEHIHFRDLSIRFGGDYTIWLQNVEGLVFDHVHIWASRTGVRMGGAADNPAASTLFRHCEFDGGLPSWFFRSDIKLRYFYVSGGKILENRLGGGTFESLLIGNPNDIGTEIDHCEFHDAHDLYLYGKDLLFHHNWIHNLNDEGMFIDAGLPQQTQMYRMNIYQNVITKTLSAISFAGNNPNGRWYIYRNLIDLRSPTAGVRPRKPGETNVWRFGHLIKMIEPDGPRDLFQNTFLVAAQHERASYRHYSSTKDDRLRRTFNNIFIAVNSDPNADKPITFIPSPSFPGPTDGNDYYRIGFTTKDAYRYDLYTFNGTNFSGGFFHDLIELRGDPDDTTKQPSELFMQSKSQYPPGYEANSKEVDPLFCQIAANGLPDQTDDLRLRLDSPAKKAGIELPPDLKAMDMFAPVSENPDMGCYPVGSDPLQVGVDSRKSYPGI